MNKFYKRELLMIFLIIPLVTKSQDYCGFIHQIQEYQNSVKLDYSGDFDIIDPETFDIHTYLSFYNEIVIENDIQIGDFWPNPYNYLEFSGSEYMKKRIDQNNSKIADFNKSVQFWIDLNSTIGFNKMNQIFEEVNSKKVRNPDAKNKFLIALKAVNDDKEIIDLYDQYSDILILDNK